MDTSPPASLPRRIPFIAATVLFVLAAGNAFGDGQIAIGLLQVVVGALNLGAARGRTPLTLYNEMALFIGDAVVALLTGWMAWHSGTDALPWVWLAVGGGYLLAAGVRSLRRSSTPS